MPAPISETKTFHMIEAVADRLEDASRQVRRRWSDGFKAEIVAEVLEPGASISAIARRVGIHPSQLFTWRRKALETKQGALQIADAEPAIRQAGGGTVEVVRWLGLFEQPAGVFKWFAAKTMLPPPWVSAG
jgi:transposase